MPPPDRTLVVKADLLIGEEHRYWSTHCRHGDHTACEATELAPGVQRRPAQCKICGAPCICGCHERSPMETDKNVTAKVIVNYKSGDDPVQVTFQPDYQDDRNQAWASATPALSLSITMKKSVADLFEMGEAIDLIFSRNPDQPQGGQQQDTEQGGDEQDTGTGPAPAQRQALDQPGL